MKHDVPAVILGAGMNGLGVARSLSRARVPVWLLDPDVRRPEMHTRAASPLRIAALQGELLIEELVRLGVTTFSGLRPILLLTQEESVRTVSQQRDRLSPLYRFSLPSPEIVDALQHKHRFQRLAEHFGYPIPPLVRIGGPADLPELERLKYPVVVKPGERHEGYGQQFKKAYRVASAAEATDLVRRILPVMSDVVVQEWTEGPDSNIYFCLQYIDRHACVIASFTGRKVRSWPPQVGGTASCAPAPDTHAELSALTAGFFQNVGVVGMAGMEYKRDAHSGQFRMVEPTIGRTDYQAEIATLNGVNLPYAAYCAELGVACPTPAGAIRPQAWRVRSEDERSATVQHQRPMDGFEEVCTVHDALWRGSDPLPYLVQNWQRIRRALRARTTRRLAGVQPAGSKP